MFNPYPQYLWHISRVECKGGVPWMAWPSGSKRFKIPWIRCHRNLALCARVLYINELLGTIYQRAVGFLNHLDPSAPASNLYIYIPLHHKKCGLHANPKFYGVRYPLWYLFFTRCRAFLLSKLLLYIYSPPQLPCWIRDGQTPRLLRHIHLMMMQRWLDLYSCQSNEQ